MPQSTTIENTEESRGSYYSLNFVNTIVLSLELTKPLESVKSDSPKAKEESDIVAATVKPSKSKGTGNGTKEYQNIVNNYLNKNRPIASNVSKAQQTESLTTTAAVAA